MQIVSLSNRFSRIAHQPKNQLEVLYLFSFRYINNNNNNMHAAVYVYVYVVAHWLM